MVVSCRLSSQQLHDELEWRRTAQHRRYCEPRVPAIMSAPPAGDDCCYPASASGREMRLDRAGATGGDVADHASCSRVGQCRQIC